MRVVLRLGSAVVIALWIGMGRLTPTLATQGDRSPSIKAIDTRSWHDIDLVLEDALWVGGKGAARIAPADLMLHTGYRDGVWRENVIGWAGEHRGRDGIVTPGERQYNQMDHEGTIKVSTEDDGTIVLKADMRINPDPWVPGGKATYTIRMKREATKDIKGVAYQFSGTFEGTFNDRRVRGKVRGEQMAYLWPAPVEGVEPAGPNEHPRLLFRKDDVPALRERMKTKEGKAILARLRYTLGGGEAMPAQYSKATHAYDSRGKVRGANAYTLWHGMGFGFLYQLTGEKKYAELAKQCVDKARQGVRDRDARYAFVRPGGKLRAGSSYAAIAMAYDLCYDAWEPSYRKALAKEIQDKVFLPTHASTGRKALKEPVDVGLVFKTRGGQHSPWSNHYGAWNGGGGSAILAIKGDDGTDDAVTERCHRIFLRRAKRALRVGYGDAAWFFEGHHGGRLSSNTGLITYMNHLRTSEGLDLVPNCPEAQWLVSKWMFEIIRQDGQLRCPQKGIYASPTFARGGMSTGGDFARGFGIAPEAHRPALLWFFNHVIEPGENKTYDAITYPHHAVFAYLYWPIGVKEKNPADVVGKVLRDHQAQYAVFRSGWSGTDDDVIAALYRGGGPVIGMGLRGNISTVGGRETSFEELSRDTCVIHYDRAALVADMHGLAGSPMTLITVRGLGSREIKVKQKGRELTEQERRFIEMLKKSSSKHRDSRLSNLPKDPPPTPEGKAAIVERHRALGDHHVTIHTIARGPAPAITLPKEGDVPAMIIGRLSVTVKDNQVRVAAVDKQ